MLLDITLVVGSGDVIALRGPNGAGKSTLLKLAAGLIAPSQGRITLFGTQPDATARARIGYVAHRPALYDDLTLNENLEFFASVGGADDHRIQQALEQVGLSGAKDRQVQHASEGMKRRLDLARLLLVDHDVLLLDEAQSGLDDQAVGLVEALVERCVDRGGCCLVVSHGSTVDFATAHVDLFEGAIV